MYWQIVLEAVAASSGERPRRVDLIVVETGLRARLRQRNSRSALSSSRRRRSAASASVPPSTYPSPGRITTSPVRRPCRPRRHRSSPGTRPGLDSRCGVNTTSAIRPARPIPAGDEPAWASTGWPCGGRGIVSGPARRSTRRGNRPGGCASLSAHTPGGGVADSAPSSQLSHSRRSTSTNSPARAYRCRARSGSLPELATPSGRRW